MSQQKSESPFGCCFCREPLEPVPFSITDFLWVLILMKPYRCPHCFQCYYRPFRILMAIPILGGLLAVIMGRLGLLPTVKSKLTKQYRPSSDSAAEIVCPKW